MEVGCSLENRPKLAQTLVQTSLYFKTNARRGREAYLLVHNRSPRSISHCIFLHHFLKNEVKLSVSSASWPLNRGNNNKRTLAGTAKKWPRPLDRGGHFILVYSLLFSTIISGALFTDHLIKGGRL